MADNLEQTLRSKGYSALPLPRANNGPTTIFRFTKGLPVVVRNAHKCLPDPPIKVTPDPAVDTVTFGQSFSFAASGLAQFVGKVLGGGQGGGGFQVKGIAKAWVTMSGLEHQTIETGAVFEYLSGKDVGEPCTSDLFDARHLIVVAALRANTFTYKFENAQQMKVNVSAQDATAIFKTSADTEVSLTTDGDVVVNRPSYVGWIMWKGSDLKKDLGRRARPGAPKTPSPGTVERGEVGDPLDNERAVGARALTPDEVEDMARTSL